MEFIKLKNGSRYQLITDGFNVGDNHVKLAFIADRSLKEIHSEFSKKENVETLCVETATGETLTVCDGYVVLDSYVSLDLHYEVSPVEYGGDGEVVKAADYGEVAFLSLYKETAESQLKELKLKQEVTAQAVQDLMLMAAGGKA